MLYTNTGAIKQIVAHSSVFIVQILHCRIVCRLYFLSHQHNVKHSKASQGSQSFHVLICRSLSPAGSEQIPLREEFEQMALKAEELCCPGGPAIYPSQLSWLTWLDLLRQCPSPGHP